MLYILGEDDEIQEVHYDYWIADQVE